MALDLDINQAHYQIRAYKPGAVQVNETIYTHSIIVSAEKLIDHWKPQCFSELQRDDLSIISELNPAILLIGTGRTLEFPEPALYGDLINKGIGIEVMDSSAACRTYIALTAENRNVAVALIIK